MTYTGKRLGCIARAVWFTMLQRNEPVIISKIASCNCSNMTRGGGVLIRCTPRLKDRNFSTADIKMILFEITINLTFRVVSQTAYILCMNLIFFCIKYKQ